MHTREESHIGSPTLSIETGKLAKQAHGVGRSSAWATRWCSSPPATPRSPREGIDFLPLTVDYREYTYASGRIPGGFFKREGKPTEKEVLTSRLIDRPIRPLFPSGWRYETQIIALVLSADTENDSDVLAITGASAALALSEIPFEKTDRRRARRPGRRRVRHQPDVRAAQAEPPRPDRRRQQGRHRDGRSRRQGSDRRGGRRARSRPAHAAIKQICDGIDDLAKEARQARSSPKPEQTIGHEFYREVEETRAGAAHRRDAHQGQARELRHGRRRCSKN